MRRVVPCLVWLILGSCAGLTQAQQSAAISGIVEDVHGTPQMGALIELRQPGIGTVATAITDPRGRYLLTKLAPGRYELHVTAAFFLPLVRNGVRLRPDVQTVANLTLDGLFDVADWLPAQRRRADDPVDDWKWTLRAMASRPLLQLVDPDDGVPISSSAEQHQERSSQGRFLLSSGDGVFGDGGPHQVLLLDRTMEDGDGAVLRADIGEVQAAGTTVQPSAALVTGYEMRSPLGGSTRLVGSFESQPELTDGSPGGGFQLLRLASAERIPIGNTLLIDVGALAQGERLEQTQFEVEPFFRLAVPLWQDLVVEYRYAMGRELQSSDDMDDLNPTLSTVTNGHGRPRNDSGMHQEISVSRRLGSSALSASVYLDRVPYAAITGSGVMSNSTLQLVHAIADRTTGIFELAGPGYAASGLSICIMQTLTPALSAWIEYDRGTALRANDGLTLEDLPAGLSKEIAEAASVALRGRVNRTGTALRIEYRWQPTHTLTQVNEFNVLPEEAYLTFYIRQRLWSGSVLPQGMDVVLEATNLLNEGDQPGEAPDGQTLILSQVPRAILGGIAFNF